MARSESKSLPDHNRTCSDTKDRAAPGILQTTVISLQTPNGNGGEAILHFFLSCYFKVELLHSITLSADLSGFVCVLKTLVYVSSWKERLCVLLSYIWNMYTQTFAKKQSKMTSDVGTHHVV